MATSDDCPAVVSTEWLKGQLNSNNTDIRVLDVTWSSQKDSRQDYLKEHIPSAFYFDIMHEAHHTSILARNLPDSASFQDYARSFGINPDTHVVVYDNEGKNGFFIGSRAWWMFKVFGHEKVSVLNGGLQKWLTDGYSITTEVPTCETGTFTVKNNPRMRKTYEEMEENLLQPGTKQFQVVDSRPRDLYSGKQEEIKDLLKGLEQSRKEEE